MAPRVGWLVLTTVLFAGAASAQVTPAPDYTPPDDTPSVRVGGTLFADYTYTLAPESDRRRRPPRSTPTPSTSRARISTSPAS